MLLRFLIYRRKSHFGTLTAAVFTAAKAPCRQNLSNLLLKVSVVVADITNSGKLLYTPMLYNRLCAVKHLYQNVKPCIISAARNDGGGSGAKQNSITLRCVKHQSHQLDTSTHFYRPCAMPFLSPNNSFRELKALILILTSYIR